METERLCESDYRFMSVIWDNEPLPSGRLVELCREQLGWKKSTTYTMLKKLCEKGFAQNVDATVTSLVPRQEVQAAQSELFVQQTFAGSLPNFLVSFLGGKTISQQEADRLKRLIDAHKEG
jgi:predicted transcriptional regulator